MGAAISKVVKLVTTQTVEDESVMNPLRKQGTQFIQEVVSTEAIMTPISEAGTSMIGDGMAKAFDKTKSLFYINIGVLMLGCGVAVNAGLNLVSYLFQPTSPRCTHDLTAEDGGNMGNSFFMGSFYMGSFMLGSAFAINSGQKVYQYLRSVNTHEDGDVYAEIV
ncbi:hypothetical protein C5167_027058 [Papaver somniferum]|uniref:uncharacterized protein LOC113336136 n=1 Tax=Papaver somniferum TaxID=3469 RepID=UPI000E704E60|nr:uncharacterized protein LOC113336136 [Papaver somniferum]RZC89518.1 hypothetical protein C5167_027058 [Papaver somniferum]